MTLLLGVEAALATLEGVPHREREPLPVVVAPRPKPGFRTTAKTKFFLDGKECSREEYFAGASVITELQAEGDEVIVIKARSK